MLNKRQMKTNENHSLCIDDIHCKNKRCYKLHIERKRLNICKFDTFFIPYKDEGCHFEDCTHIHPKRDTFCIQKEKDFEHLIDSVVNHLNLDDNIPLIEDWKRLMNNVYDDFNEMYQELYMYCSNINTLSFQLEKLIYNTHYVYYMENILSNIYENHQKFKDLFKSMILRYDEHKEEYMLLYNKVQEDIHYVDVYKYNAKKMLYQNYGIQVNF